MIIIQLDIAALTVFVKKLKYLPCPRAFPLKCRINPNCIARVAVKLPKSDQFSCYYENIPIAEKEIICLTTVGILRMLGLEDKCLIRLLKQKSLIDRSYKAKRVILTKDPPFFPKTPLERQMFLFASGFLANSLYKRETCFACIYNSIEKSLIATSSTK